MKCYKSSRTGGEHAKYLHSYLSCLTRSNYWNATIPIGTRQPTYGLMLRISFGGHPSHLRPRRENSGLASDGALVSMTRLSPTTYPKQEKRSGPIVLPRQNLGTSLLFACERGRLARRLNRFCSAAVPGSALS